MHGSRIPTAVALMLAAALSWPLLAGDRAAAQANAPTGAVTRPAGAPENPAGAPAIPPTAPGDADAETAATPAEAEGTLQDGPPKNGALAAKPPGVGGRGPGVASAEANPSSAASPAGVADAAPVSPLVAAAEKIEAKRLNVGVLNNAPPFSFVSEHGYRTGFDYAVARAACARLNLRCTFVPLVPEDVAVALDERRIDVAATSIPITAENDKVFDFTRPYYATAARFVGRKRQSGDSDAEAASGGAETIGVLAGTPHAAYLAKQANGDAVHEYFHPDEMLVDLALHRLDKIFLSAIAAKQRVLSDPIGASLSFLGGPASDPDIFGRGQGLAVRDGDAPLREALDLAVADLIRSGDLNDIRDRYLDPDLHVAVREER